MRLRTSPAILATGALALLSATFAAQGAMPSAPLAQPSSFAQCRVCHSVTKSGPAGIGPNLFGSFGAIAGTRPGYAYSPAMKASKARWDRVRLDAYLANPRATVPGTRMVFGGVKDPAARKAIVDYLAGLK
jgi:cytochrome c